jgi:hypothetical protein
MKNFIKNKKQKSKVNMSTQAEKIQNARIAVDLCEAQSDLLKDPNCPVKKANLVFHEARYDLNCRPSSNKADKQKKRDHMIRSYMACADAKSVAEEEAKSAAEVRVARDNLLKDPNCPVKKTELAWREALYDLHHRPSSDHADKERKRKNMYRLYFEFVDAFQARVSERIRAEKEAEAKAKEEEEAGRQAKRRRFQEFMTAPSSSRSLPPFSLVLFEVSNQ